MIDCCRLKSKDNVVEEFVRQAATSGMDIFRIFDCFNDVEQMKVSINAVRKMKKARNMFEAVLCICELDHVRFGSRRAGGRDRYVLHR